MSAHSHGIYAENESRATSESNESRLRSSSGFKCKRFLREPESVLSTPSLRPANAAPFISHKFRFDDLSTRVSWEWEQNSEIKLHTDTKESQFDTLSAPISATFDSTSASYGTFHNSRDSMKRIGDGDASSRTNTSGVCSQARACPPENHRVNSHKRVRQCGLSYTISADNWKAPKITRSETNTDAFAFSERNRSTIQIDVSSLAQLLRNQSHVFLRVDIVDQHTVASVKIPEQDSVHCIQFNTQANLEEAETVPIQLLRAFVKAAGRSNRLRIVCCDAKNIMCKLFRNRFTVITLQFILGEFLNQVELLDLSLLAWMFSPDKFAREFEDETGVDSLRMFLKHDSSNSGGCRTSSSDSVHEFFLVCESLHEHVEGKLYQEGLDVCYFLQELPTAICLAYIQSMKIKMDRHLLKRSLVEHEKLLHFLENSAFECSGQEFSLGSPHQSAQVLYDCLGLKGRAIGGTSRSTSIEALEHLIDLHPTAALITAYRKVAKIINSYLRPINTFSENVDGQAFLNVTLNQCRTGTGRLSCTKPNLQSTPCDSYVDEIKSILDSHQIEYEPVLRLKDVSVRRTIVPRSNTRMLLSVDYSQIEVRVLAYASGDKNLRRVFQTDDAVDVYVELASQIYEAEAHVITDEQRKHAKVALLSTIYGVGVKEMGRKLMVSTKAATALRDRLHKRFPGIAAFTKLSKDFCLKRGFILTIAGRKRLLPSSGTEADVHKIDRQSINSIIQGSASDIMKAGLLSVLHDLPAVQVLLQLHDELLIEVPHEAVHQLGAAIKTAMNTGARRRIAKLKKHASKHIDSFNELWTPGEFDIPLRVSMKYGHSWGSLEP